MGDIYSFSIEVVQMLRIAQSTALDYGPLLFRMCVKNECQSCRRKYIPKYSLMLLSKKAWEACLIM